MSDLYSVSLDYLLSDSADAPEQNRRISNEPDGEMVTISDSADGGKKGKQKTAKWLAIVMVVVLFYFGNMIFLIGQARNLLQMKQKPY